MMALIGVGYTFVEHRRHVNDPAWPWPTFLAVFVLGVAGPALSWVVLRWAVQAANAYMETQEQLVRRAEELRSLNKLSLATSRTLEPETRIATILEQTMEALEAQAGMVFIQQNDHAGLHLEAHRGISLEMAQKEAHLRPGQCLCGQAVTHRQVLLADDVGDDPRCTSDLCICEGFRSVACAPLEARGQLVGLLQLASPQKYHFTNDRKAFLSSAAAQVSISIENARLYNKVRDFNVELEQMVNHRTSELEAARWALAEKARQLQRLLSESYRIQEDTQARIAHDMHDGVTQIIIGALYEIQAARQGLVDEPDRAAENLFKAQQLLSEVEVEIRRVIYDLHPPVLDMMGLVVALKRYATTFATTFEIDCQIEVLGKHQRLPKKTEVAIYRIIQAALQNVAAHAEATRVQLSFDFRSNDLSVIVEDNGIGFDPKKALETPGDHLGLIGMKERAEGLGAVLEVDSALKKGTRVKLFIPSPKYIEKQAVSKINIGSRF
ncbi:MAG: GAF domain-containing sensor histidine kinase [Anaerolineales bacterium]